MKDKIKKIYNLSKKTEFKKERFELYCFILHIPCFYILPQITCAIHADAKIDNWQGFINFVFQIRFLFFEMGLKLAFGEKK